MSLPELEPGIDVVLEPEARNYVDYFAAQVPVVEDRLKRGQIKHKPLPPVLLDPRDMPEEGWQEWHDLGFYLWRMRLLVEALRGEVAKRDARIAELEGECDDFRRVVKDTTASLDTAVDRIAELEGDNARMRGAGNELAAILIDLWHSGDTPGANDYGRAIAWQEATDGHE